MAKREITVLDKVLDLARIDRSGRWSRRDYTDQVQALKAVTRGFILIEAADTGAYEVLGSCLLSLCQRGC